MLKRASDSCCRGGGGTRNVADGLTLLHVGGSARGPFAVRDRQRGAGPLTETLLPLLSGSSFSTPCSISSCRVRLVDIFLSSSVSDKQIWGYFLFSLQPVSLDTITEIRNFSVSRMFCFVIYCVVVQ